MKPVFILALLCIVLPSSFGNIFGDSLPALRTATQLLSETNGREVSGIPWNAVWASDAYDSSRKDYFSENLREYVSVRWREKEKAYRGLYGADSYRALPLSSTRILFEQVPDFHSDENRDNELGIVDWDGRTLIKYSLDRSPESRLAGYLRGKGLSISEGRISGGRDRILSALETYEFRDNEIDRRLSLPRSKDLRLLWGFSELMAWKKRQEEPLRDVELHLEHYQTLGALGLTQLQLSNVSDSGVGSMDPMHLRKFSFNYITEDELKDFQRRAVRQYDRAEEMIAARLALLGQQISSKELIATDRGKPSPGWNASFHIEVRTSSGQLLESTRQRGKPAAASLVGGMPEGLAFALCSTGVGGRKEFKIPPELGWGEQYGAVTVDLEVLDLSGGARDQPMFEKGFSLTGKRIRPLEGEQTPSELIYHILGEGEGPSPQAGQTVTVGSRVRDLYGRELLAAGERSLVVGDDSVMRGISEGLQMMSVGGQYIFWVPPHLAYEDRERRGAPVRVELQLISIDD